MQFGTINGNAHKAHDSALGWLTIHPGLGPFLSALGPARLAMYRHSVIRLSDDWFYPEADYSYREWWETGLTHYAGRGIEVAAGLQ